ncbi:Uncharacterized protein Rs2_04602 [Raphanus sativus]|nr:Uncharacterized protein Rs2_04602 [Raphanus sativus]
MPGLRFRWTCHNPVCRISPERYSSIINITSISFIFWSQQASLFPQSSLYPSVSIMPRQQKLLSSRVLKSFFDADIVLEADLFPVMQGYPLQDLLIIGLAEDVKYKNEDLRGI